MFKHKLIDANSDIFYWYSGKNKPLYSIEQAASSWYGRALILV